MTLQWRAPIKFQSSEEEFSL